MWLVSSVCNLIVLAMVTEWLKVFKSSLLLHVTSSGAESQPCVCVCVLHHLWKQDGSGEWVSGSGWSRLCPLFCSPAGQRLSLSVTRKAQTVIEENHILQVIHIFPEKKPDTKNLGLLACLLPFFAPYLCFLNAGLKIRHPFPWDTKEFAPFGF